MTKMNNKYYGIDECSDDYCENIEARVLDKAVRKHLFFIIQNNLDKTIAMRLFNCLDKLNWNAEYDMIDENVLDKLQNYPNSLEDSKEFEKLLENILRKVGLYE